MITPGPNPTSSTSSCAAIRNSPHTQTPHAALVRAMTRPPSRPSTPRGRANMLIKIARPNACARVSRPSPPPELRRTGGSLQPSTAPIDEPCGLGRDHRWRLVGFLQQLFNFAAGDGIYLKLLLLGLREKLRILHSVRERLLQCRR